ncbi:MAG: hypothetical protein QXF76_01260 [Candidatus Anstonellales archaeon]
MGTKEVNKENEDVNLGKKVVQFNSLNTLNTLDTLKKPLPDIKTRTYDFNNNIDIKELEGIFGKKLVDQLRKEFKEAKALRIINNRKKEEITIVIIGKNNRILATGSINRNKDTNTIVTKSIVA